MRYEAIEEEKWQGVMEKLTNEIRPILEEARTEDERDAFKLFLGTMLIIMNGIFDYLPPEEQSHILTACGTWFDIGLLMGRSPGKLVEVMDRVNPGIVSVELPDWVSRFVESLTKSGQ